MKAWTLVFTVISIYLIFIICGQTAPMQGLVLYFTFDEGKGETAKDLSGRGNDGLLKGGPKRNCEKEKTVQTFLEYPITVLSA